jgi:hypothetical protein
MRVKRLQASNVIKYSRKLEAGTGNQRFEEVGFLPLTPRHVVGIHNCRRLTESLTP